MRGRALSLQPAPAILWLTYPVNVGGGQPLTVRWNVREREWLELRNLTRTASA